MTRRYLVSGPYRLDLVDERLWRDGEARPLRGKAFAVLRALMETPQTLITKDELFERVWPGVTVSESVLTSTMKDLRRALSDDARNPHAIETVHGRGYRFLSPVQATDDAKAPASPIADAPTTPRASRRRLVLGAIAGLGVVAALATGAALLRDDGGTAEKSVAVLPFEDLSATRDQVWFADGLTEEVLNTLARTPDLRVVSRQASARFRDSDREPVEVARRLRVAHVLQGSTRRSGSRLRVSVQLIRAVDGAHVWSKTYDRKVEDVISIQEDIAFDIARALKTVMQPAKLRAMVEIGTRSVDAYEAYLRGLALEQRHLAEGDVRLTTQAGDAYEQARVLDPGFAAAHWRAAQSWYGNTTRLDSAARAGVSEADRKREFLTRIDRAVATSHDDVEKLKYASAGAAIELHFRTAHRLMARYLEARPRDLEAWDKMSDLAGYASERAWVARAAEQIHAVSMQDGLPLSRAITVSVNALEWNAAARRAREQLAVLPESATTQYQAHRAFLSAGRTDEARSVLERIRSSKMKPDAIALAELRQACAEGRVADAKALRRLIDATGGLAPRWHAAQTVGDARGAEALLRPYDRPEGLPILMQFMTYPSFDARPYATLNALLVHEGVNRPPPTPLPYACKAA